MASSLSTISPFLLITILCIGAVEGGYQLLEHLLLQPTPETLVKKVNKAATEPLKNTAASKQYDHTIILTRQLFGPPPNGHTKPQDASLAKPAEEKLPEKPSDPDLILVGTITGGRDISRAYMFSKKGGKQELYREGEYIDDKMVREIKKGSVTLSSQGGDETLDISEAASIRPSNSAPVPVEIEKHLPIQRSTRIRKDNKPVRQIPQDMIPAPAFELPPKQNKP